LIDEPHPTRPVPVEPHRLGVHAGFIDEYQPGRIKHASLANPFAARTAQARRVAAAVGEEWSAEAKPRSGSVSSLEVHATQPDATVVEMLLVLKKWGIHTSRSALWRFFGRHDITFKKKSLCASERQPRMWCGPASRSLSAQSLLLITASTAVINNRVVC
jgi:hypothetical protein